MKNLFTLFLCLSCLISCDQTAYPFEPNEGGFMPGGLPVAFDKSLTHSNEILDQQLDLLLKQMEQHAYDRPHQKPISDLANTIRQKTEALEREIAGLKAEMAKPKGLYLYEGAIRGKSKEQRQTKYESQGFNNFVMIADPYFDGLPVDLSDKSMVKQLFIRGQSADALKKTLQATRNQILEEIEDFIKTEGNNIKGVRFELSAFGTLEKELALAKIPDHEDTDWGRQTFERLNIGNAYALLSKYEHDAKNAVLQAMTYLSSNMGRVALAYDKFDVLSYSPKPAIRLGEIYEAEIALGAFSSQAEFSVSVNGRVLPVVDGKAQFSAKPGSVGTQFYKATITIVNPLTGKTEKVSKEFHYEVID
jgi:hypothetical protein